MASQGNRGTEQGNSGHGEATEAGLAAQSDPSNLSLLLVIILTIILRLISS